MVAVDGGNPPKTGTMTINVQIQDLNDNPPTFSKQRYFTAVSDDLRPGDSVFKVRNGHCRLIPYMI